MPTHEGKCDLCRIEMDNVNVRRGHSVLLRDINLHIHCGELTALIGPNGAGKTTLLKALMGIIPHDGNIAHFKHDGSTLSQVRVGYVPQRLDMDVDTPVSVMDLVQSAIGGRPSWLGPSREDKERARNLLSVTHVEGLINRRVGALSGGELQRVLLARLAPIATSSHASLSAIFSPVCDSSRAIAQPVTPAPIISTSY